MERDEEINTKPIKLSSEFIRRKRELTRLSGDFKKCLFEVAKKQDILEKINSDIKNNWKSIAIDGKVTEIDKEEKQEIEFAKKKTIKKDRKEVADSYVNFCAKMTSGYAKSRSTNIIKSAIRALFNVNLNIGDEDDISAIVMNRSNNPLFRRLLEEAKENYANLPTKDEEIVINEKWEVPKSISIFTDYEILETSNKSIIKETESQRLFVKKNKNRKIELSNPEIKFINNLDNTDDDILWWFKNGAKESKYFGIAYKKRDNHFYGFYPDFIIKTKKETLIVEIKDDKDFKPENALKLQAGKNYVSRTKNKEKIRFFMLSPIDYDLFFSLLKNQEIEKFNSLYEEKLLRYNQSQKKLIENKVEYSEKDKENLELLSELDSTINELENQKLKTELLEMELADAKENFEALSKTFVKNKLETLKVDKLKIKFPFNICVLGEVSEVSQIRKELNNYFEKIGIKTKDWNIDFLNNKKLQSSNVLRSLHKGQSKYSVIITGQIFHHSGKGNTKANIISELKNEKYVPHCIGSNPKDLLTSEKMIETINNYLKEKPSP